jgi:hypothetical protein
VPPGVTAARDTLVLGSATAQHPTRRSASVVSTIVLIWLTERYSLASALSLLKISVKLLHAQRLAILPSTI